jgi:hypothetical protein
MLCDFLIKYRVLQVRRAEVIQYLLLDNIKVLLFEADCLWIRNPLPQLESMAEDFVVLPVSTVPGQVAAGFLYMVPSSRMRKMWKALTEKLGRLGARIAKKSDNHLISEAENDNIYLTSLVSQSYGGLRTKFMPANEYPDGRWYKMSEANRNKIKPMLINNNWIIGNAAKIKRAKKWGHWFLNDDGTCNATQVNSVISKFKL